MGHLFRKTSKSCNTSHLITSISRGGTSHFSSDLSSGRRPKSKSVEKCEVPPLVIEIMSETAHIKCFPLSEHDSARHGERFFEPSQSTFHRSESALRPTEFE